MLLAVEGPASLSMVPAPSPSAHDTAARVDLAITRKIPYDTVSD